LAGGEPAADLMELAAVHAQVRDAQTVPAVGIEVSEKRMPMLEVALRAQLGADKLGVVALEGTQRGHDLDALGATGPQFLPGEWRGRGLAAAEEDQRTADGLAGKHGMLDDHRGGPVAFVVLKTDDGLDGDALDEIIGGERPQTSSMRRTSTRKSAVARSNEVVRQ
jgi:hypothetical protein